MKSKNILRVIAAIIGGEVVLVLLTAFVQEVLFDGITYSSSSTFDIAVGGFLTFLASIGAGWVCGKINKSSIVPAIIMSILVITEMSWLIYHQRTGDPIWFDILAGGSLIIGIWIGFMPTTKGFLKA